MNRFQRTLRSSTGFVLIKKQLRYGERKHTLSKSVFPADTVAKTLLCLYQYPLVNVASAVRLFATGIYNVEKLESSQAYPQAGTLVKSHFSESVVLCALS